MYELNSKTICLDSSYIFLIYNLIKTAICITHYKNSEYLFC